jgi:hypothetical protein
LLVVVGSFPNADAVNATRCRISLPVTNTKCGGIGLMDLTIAVIKLGPGVSMILAL